MSRCPSAQQLERLLEEQLSADEHGAVSAHVGACESCQATLERLTDETGAGSGPLAPVRGQEARRQEAEVTTDRAQEFLGRLKQRPPSPAPPRPDRRTDCQSVPRADEGEPRTNPFLSTASVPTAARWPVVAGYEVLSELGRGGMGVVYKARQTGLHRLVALKMLLAGAQAAPRNLARFRLEAEAVARVQHPNIVQIHEIGESEGRPYFVLEYVEGGSLASRTCGAPQAAEAAARLVETLARAIHVAHQQGIVHRDLKPSNILLVSGGVVSGGVAANAAPDSPLTTHQPKITDFGLAKRLDGSDAWTQTGEVVGTPSYLAPEQAAGKGRLVGPAADVYALGAILYELLTGRPPFQAETPLDTVLQVLHEEAVPPGRLRPKLPPELETICLKCLEKEPHRRYLSAAALADDLQRWLAGEPVLARPPRWPRRVGRFLRRPAVRKVAVGLVLGLAVATTVLTVGILRKAEPLTPAEREARRQEQERQTVRDNLAAGRTVQLLGQAGQLPWFRWAVSGPTDEVFATADGALGVRCHNSLGLLELVPDPQYPHYRFSVEVRHEETGPVGGVGIYWAYSLLDTPGKTQHYLVGLRFNDWVDIRRPVAGLAPSGVTSSGQLEVSIESYPPLQRARVLPLPIETAFARGIAPPWHRLAVEVRPNQMQVFWEGQEVGAVSRDGLMCFLPSLLHLARTPPVDVRLAPRSPLGLYVAGGAASFRHLVVEPLAEDN